MTDPHRTRVVVITGASSGIGRGAALAFAGRGDAVVLAARGRSHLEEVAGECRALGARAVVVPTDVSDEQAVQELATRAVAELGRIDAWVNAAAVWSYGRFEDTPGPVFRQIVDTNLFGQVHAARAVLPRFRSQGHGVLVNVVSLYGRVTTPYVSPYVTSKWGLLGFTEVLRHELRTKDVHVCAVLPGAVDTPIYRHAANYLGHEIRPLPPVLPPDRVVSALLRAVDRPKRQIVVGRMQHVGAWAHQLTPGLYERLAGPVTRAGAVRRAPAQAGEGNVFAPDPAVEGASDGWRRHDHRRAAQVLAAASVGGLAAVGLARRRLR